MDTNKTKIIIFYASYGGGHLNAAKSIESYLKSTYPNFEVELIDCMKYVNIGIEKKCLGHGENYMLTHKKEY